MKEPAPTDTVSLWKDCDALQFYAIAVKCRHISVTLSSGWTATRKPNIFVRGTCKITNLRVMTRKCKISMQVGPTLFFRIFSLPYVGINYVCLHYREGKCAKSYNDTLNLFLNCNQHFANFKP